MRPQTAAEFARNLNEVLEQITLDKVPQLKIGKNISKRIAGRANELIL